MSQIQPFLISSTTTALAPATNHLSPSLLPYQVLIDIIKLSFKHIAATYTFTNHICECPFLHVLASTGFYQILIFANLIIYRFNLVLH